MPIRDGVDRFLVIGDGAIDVVQLPCVIEATLKGISNVVELTTKVCMPNRGGLNRFLVIGDSVIDVTKLPCVGEATLKRISKVV